MEQGRGPASVISLDSFSKLRLMTDPETKRGRTAFNAAPLATHTCPYWLPLRARQTSPAQGRRWLKTLIGSAIPHLRECK